MTLMDLNADLGEGVGDDSAMLSLVTSASIACGGHAGDESTMRAALRAAGANGVRIGAHPGYPDRENFGRRRLDLPLGEVVGQILVQLEVLARIAREEGAEVCYVKLHGALANAAAEDFSMARAIFAAVHSSRPGYSVMALAASEQERAARALGMPVIREAYADRGYLPSGQLAPRGTPGSVLTDPALVVDRCLALAGTGEIGAVDGSPLTIHADSICVHGDTPGALALARAIREALSGQGPTANRPAGN